MKSVADQTRKVAPAMRIDRTDARGPVLRFSGTWTLDQAPDIDELAAHAERELGAGDELRIDMGGVDDWDTSLPMTMVRILADCADRGVSVESDSLPGDVANLVKLATAGPEQDVVQAAEPSGFVARIGEGTVASLASATAAVTFCGKVAAGFGRMLRGKSCFRWKDFPLLLGNCGFRALPIVGLIAFLTGLILAFVGAIQLRMFGADLYVADLVGVAMSREMGALMTGVIMAGRSGAAFAAHIGTMKVSEELDALETFGFSAIDMLVLPRLLALILMMPLLCLYADLVGFFGGAFIGVSMLDISFAQYVTETQTIVTTRDIGLGVVKSAVFGFLVGASGCMQGIQCGSNAAAVGHAATRAVVLSITLIVVADAIFAVICEVLHI